MSAFWTRTGTWGIASTVVPALLSGNYFGSGFKARVQRLDGTDPTFHANEVYEPPYTRFNAGAASGRRSEETKTGELSCLWLLARAIRQHRSGFNARPTLNAGYTTNSVKIRNIKVFAKTTTHCCILRTIRTMIPTCTAYLLRKNKYLKLSYT